MKKVRAKSPKAKRAPKQGHKFLLISEEMKQWSAMLQSELNSLPAITTKSMFGFVFFYRRKRVFAALPRTRGFDSPSSVLFKFDPMPPALQRRAQSDPRMSASMEHKSKGWFSFNLNAEGDLRDALFWLHQAYESAAK
jgi:hypothetical protein